MPNQEADATRTNASRPAALDLGALVGGRLCRVFDDQVPVDLARKLESTFASLTFCLAEADRPDVDHVRHFVHELPVDGHSVVEFVADRMRFALAELLLDHREVERAYVNLSLHGDFQHAHVDGEQWTGLLFLCGEWQSDWGGELLVYGDARGVAIAIEPRPGRLVLFDGALLHRGGAPSRRYDGPRMTLAVKLAKAT